ncbi:DUF134 domain-containing protein [Tepidibacter formicigenes]|uniref:UPF0251 protein SAMN02744037_02224 n=1 Tax=Tepidibacter formicigenes DSM 15518 TaxID=1123349 RepID=A0A1M6S022_9FIRM|nr:DUF134 domain-containing protein [Tepidibacter formicigenes]SHK38114.1 Predicted DNA-binding protein, UPF0251 family [Tepidibacter formicigenes DSM 15518]
MPRPIKPRKISFVPKNRYFVPYGKQKCSVDEIELKFEEVEAMRLKDIENLSQEECAKRMNVSRQTFQLIIDEARKKVALALTKGMAINIQGGNYTFNICKYKCVECGKEFDKVYEQNINACPECDSEKIACIQKKNCCMKSCRKRWCKDIKEIEEK